MRVASHRLSLVFVTARTDRVAQPPATRPEMLRVLSVVAVASLCGGLVFQANSVGLPKLFDERLAGLVTGTLGGGNSIFSARTTLSYDVIRNNHVDQWVYATVAVCGVRCATTAYAMFLSRCVAVALLERRRVC